MVMVSGLGRYTTMALKPMCHQWGREKEKALSRASIELQAARPKARSDSERRTHISHMAPAAVWSVGCVLKRGTMSMTFCQQPCHYVHAHLAA